jgi:preprotein translocase subunit SecD
VISSNDGACTAPALTSDKAATACDRAGTTTYDLAPVLGVITPDSVTLSEDPGSTNSVTLDLNDTDTATLEDASRAAVDKNLAVILDGRVLSAPLVQEALTSSPLTLMFETAAEAEQVVADMSAQTSP